MLLKGPKVSKHCSFQESDQYFFLLFLSAPVPPSLTPSPPTVTVTEGDTALLTCAVIGDPFPVLTWYRMGTLLAGESGTSLTLVGVVKEQEGVYECAASSLAGDDRASIMLVVNSESLSFLLPPPFPSLSLSLLTLVSLHTAHPTADASPATLELPIGSTASFTCTSSGDPAPLITWYNENGIDVLSLGDPRAQVSGGTLAISSIIESDSQQYTCTASNVVGSNSTTVELDVLGEPLKLVHVPLWLDDCLIMYIQRLKFSPPPHLQRPQLHRFPPPSLARRATPSPWTAVRRGTPLPPSSGTRTASWCPPTVASPSPLTACCTSPASSPRTRAATRV